MSEVYILGFTKCATTSVYDALKSSDDVSCPDIKEPHYHFSNVLEKQYYGPADSSTVAQMFVSNKKKYNMLYSKGKVKVDASAMSVNDTNVMQHIKDQAGENAKFIIMLRDPVQRAFSAYSHMRRDARESLCFKDAIAEELSGKRDNWLPIWHYVDSSCYVNKIYAARKLFGNDLLILTHESFVRDSVALMDEIADFIGIKRVNWEIKHSNRSGEPRSKLVQKIVMRKSLLKSVVSAIIPRVVLKRIKSKVVDANIGEKISLNVEDTYMLRKVLVAERERISDFEFENPDRELLDKLYQGL